jgi:predicted glycoside hydrolase/deacetylase ChbG (UPF0249 family)
LTFRKQLVVNADDFGFTPDVNEGIVDAHTNGILTATTLMANGAAFEDAVRLARDHPSLDVGCHLVLVGGNSLVDGKPLPATVPQLLAALARRRIDVYGELRAQVQRIVATGIRPTHLDTHKHTHLTPPVLEAVARLSEEFGIPWVRRPFDFPLTAYSGAVPIGTLAASYAMSILGRKFRGVLEAHHCRATNHFAGFQITGRFRTRELVELLAIIPEGSTELMCHPGRCSAALQAAPTRLKESREAELAALTAPEVRVAIGRAGIELATYAQVEFYSGE